MLARGRCRPGRLAAIHHRAAMLRLQPLEQGSHPARQAFEGEVLIGEHRVAAERRRVLRVDDGRLVRPRAERHVRMPKTADIDRAIAGLLHIDENLRATGDGGRLYRIGERVVVDVSEARREGGVLLRRQRPLPPEEQNEMLEKGIMDVGEVGIGNLARDVGAEDFGTERACQRPYLDSHGPPLRNLDPDMPRPATVPSARRPLFPSLCLKYDQCKLLFVIGIDSNLKS